MNLREGRGQIAAQCKAVALAGLTVVLIARHRTCGVPPSDLTTIAQRNGGTFPKARVEVFAHSTRG